MVTDASGGLGVGHAGVAQGANNAGYHARYFVLSEYGPEGLEVRRAVLCAQLWADLGDAAWCITRSA